MEFEKLQDIIADVLNVQKEEIKPETTFVDDLGADSLDIFQIIMGIEEEFDIEIDNDEAEKIVTVQDAVDQIKKAVEKRNKSAFCNEKAPEGFFVFIMRKSGRYGYKVKGIRKEDQLYI